MSTDPAAVSRFVTIEDEFRAWRSQHPQATLTELEVELDRRLRQARSRLLSDVAGAVPASADAVRPQCPDCGASLVASGTRRRTLRSHNDEPLTLRRAYLRCLACGAGLSPPG